MQPGDPRPFPFPLLVPDIQVDERLDVLASFVARHLERFGQDPNAQIEIEAKIGRLRPKQTRYTSHDTLEALSQALQAQQSWSLLSVESP